jgi:hypothetical protein
MNNKGFMMAEVIVVASIILIAMVGLYTSYNKIFSLYNQRIDYYDVTTLYELAEIRKNTNFSVLISKSEIPQSNSNNKVYYLNKNDVSSLEVTNKTFKDYLEFLSTSLEVESDNILVMERCITTDNCKYAYLEVFK